MDSSAKLFLQYFEFSSFILFVFFALLQLNHRKKMMVNYYLSMFFLAVGYQFLYLWMYGMGILARIPVLINTEIAVCFLLGPLFFRYFRIIFGFRQPGKLIAFLHYIPFILSVFIIAGYNLIAAEVSELYIRRGLLLPVYDSFQLVIGMNHLGDLSMALYLGVTFFLATDLLRAKEKSPEIRGILVFVLLIFINVILSVISSVFIYPNLFLLNVVVYSVLASYYMFFSFRYPEYCQKVIQVSRDIRYRKSIIKKLDIQKVESRLMELMESEKVYRNNELTLQSLSALLLITPHQLSQLLNSQRGMNFRSFVNYYRIEEAKRLLIEEPDSGILEIAFSVGFNSKSVFNSAFLKSEGSSPRDYRKKVLISA